MLAGNPSNKGGYLQAALATILVAATLMLTYVPVMLADYAKLDTVGVFANVYFARFEALTSWTAIQGRPVASFWIHVFFGAADSMDGLRVARSAGLAGTLLLGLTLWHILCRCGRSRFEAAALAITITCIPGITTFTAWTVCFTYPWAAVLSVWGGWSCLEGSVKGRLWLAAAGAGAIQIALWTYQPSALYALVPLVAVLLPSSPAGYAGLKHGLSAQAWLAGSLGFYYLVYKGLFLKWMPPISEAMQARLKPSTDAGSKLQLLFNRAIPESLEGWAWFAGDIFGRLSLWLTLLLLAGGLIAAVRHLAWKNFLPRALLLVGLLIFSLVPVLYLSGGAPYFRIMGPFTALVVLLVMGTVGHLLARTRVAIAGIWLVALLQAWGAGWVVRTHWVEPSARELAAYRLWFTEHASTAPPEALVLTTSKQWVYEGLRRRYLYGFISTNQYWVMEPMTRLILAELHGREAAVAIPIYLSGNEPANLSVLEVDANRIFAAAER